MYANPFSGTFFLDWAKWARLTLILAGCFVIVLTAAYTVKFKMWLRDRRFEKRAAQQAERGETALVSHPSDRIPFGIRALIEDAQVEGVWHSRPLTPLYQNDIPDHNCVSFDGPASASPTRGGSSVSSTAVPEAADMSNASPYVPLPSPKLQVRLLAPAPRTRRYIIGGQNRSTSSNPRHTVSEYTDPLERMKAVRSIHAAESGQLIPRWSTVY